MGGARWNLLRYAEILASRLGTLKHTVQIDSKGYKGIITYVDYPCSTQFGLSTHVKLEPA